MQTNWANSQPTQLKKITLFWNCNPKYLQHFLLFLVSLTIFSTLLHFRSYPRPSTWPSVKICRLDSLTGKSGRGYIIFVAGVMKSKLYSLRESVRKTWKVGQEVQWVSFFLFFSINCLTSIYNIYNIRKLAILI